MAENVVASNTNGNDLWFLSDTGEEHIFRAEGRVRRVVGENNRVKFTGSCVLQDAPQQKLQLQGFARVTLTKDMRERVARPSIEEVSSTVELQTAESISENAVNEFAEAELATGTDEELEEEVTSDSQESMSNWLHEMIDGGNMFEDILVSDADTGSGTAGQFRPVRAITTSQEGIGSSEDIEQDREGSEFSEDIRTDTDRSTPEGIDWSSELSDSVFLHTPQNDVDRLEQAIAEGHVVVSRGAAVGTVERSSRLREAISRSHVVTSRVGGTYQSPEETSQDQPSLISPIRRLRFVNEAENQDDPFFFSPLPWHGPTRAIGDEDDPDAVSPVRHLKHDIGPDDELLVFTPIPPRRRIVHSPVTPQEASEEEDLVTAQEASVIGEVQGQLMGLDDQQPGPSGLRFEIEEAFYSSTDRSTSTRSTSGDNGDIWQLDMDHDTGSEDVEEEFGHLIMRRDDAQDRLIDATNGAFEVTDDAGIFTAAVVELLTKRVLTNAWIAAQATDPDILMDIYPENVARGIREDAELGPVLNDVVVPLDSTPAPANEE